MNLSSPALTPPCQALVSPAVQPGSGLKHPPLKLGIMASGTGSNFVAIANAIAQQTLAAQIQLVIYNNPDAPVADRARERGIPAYLLNHRDFSQREDFDQQIVDLLHAADVEWVVMVGWMRRVTRVLIDAFPITFSIFIPAYCPVFQGSGPLSKPLSMG